MSVSSVFGLRQNTDSHTSSAIIQCSEKLIQMQHNLQLEEKQKKKAETYVIQYLFKDHKFIPSHKMLIYSMQKQSISYLVSWFKHQRLISSILLVVIFKVYWKSHQCSKKQCCTSCWKLFLKCKNFCVNCIYIVILQTVCFLYK